MAYAQEIYPGISVKPEEVKAIVYITATKDPATKVGPPWRAGFKVMLVDGSEIHHLDTELHDDHAVAHQRATVLSQMAQNNLLAVTKALKDASDPAGPTVTA